MTWSKCKTTDQKLSQFYQLQFDALKTWQSRLLDFTSYCEQKAEGQSVIMNMNFRFS